MTPRTPRTSSRTAARRLPYRLTLPGIDGALFTGSLPEVPITAPTSFDHDLRDAAGKVIFSGRY